MKDQCEGPVVAACSGCPTVLTSIILVAIHFVCFEHSGSGKNMLAMYLCNFGGLGHFTYHIRMQLHPFVPSELS